MTDIISVETRKAAFDSISRNLAITRFDLEHHQVINDLSLNIHGENFFRDVFNFVYETNFINANSQKQNAPSIDLIDRANRKSYQITTSRGKEKLDSTFEFLNEPEQKSHELRIYFLLTKPRPTTKTKLSFQKKYGVRLEDCLFDYTDLLRDINNLETTRLLELERRYFSTIKQKYTDEIVLDLTIHHLIAGKKHIRKRYDDDFGSIETTNKLQLNRINARLSAALNAGLDDQVLILRLDNEGGVLDQLRSLVIDDIYKGALFQSLQSRVSRKVLLGFDANEMHSSALEHSVDFNRVIDRVHEDIVSRIELQDFNSHSIAWVIIGHFFEICDIGVHDNGTSR